MSMRCLTRWASARVCQHRERGGLCAQLKGEPRALEACGEQAIGSAREPRRGHAVVAGGRRCAERARESGVEASQLLQPPHRHLTRGDQRWPLGAVSPRAAASTSTRYRCTQG